MYRQYTITGTNKIKNRLLFLLWALLAAGSREICFLIGRRQFIDTYGYFAQAMIRSEKSKPVINSCLSYTFTQGLSGLLYFTGNLIHMAGFCQMVIQVLWILLFLIGISMLFGKAAGFTASGILMISPWILKSMFLISPENYYMLVFSLFLVMLGYFFSQAREGRWHKSLWCGIYLIVTGMILGILCIWHYLGWVLIPLLVYMQLCNYFELRDKFKEEKSLMGVGAQGFLLIIGLALEMGAAFISYIRVTGFAIAQQLNWWVVQMTDFQGRQEEVSALLILWLITAIVAGIFFQWIYKRMSQPEEEGMPMEEENYVVTQDHRKVKLLDNPLPVPKKHVKKEIGFDLDDVVPDFDYEISENDDFDI